MGIAEDLSQPTPTHPTGTTTTTAPFTPPVGALLVALVAADGSSTASTSASVTDSLGGSWTLLKRVNAFSPTNSLGGTAEVWCRDSPGAQLTVTASGWASNGGDLTVRVLTGAKPAAQQTGATGASTTGASVPPTAILTPTQVGSFIYGAALDYTTNASLTANAQSTSIDQFNDATNGDTWATFKASGATSSLTSTTYGYTNANAQYNVAAVEILASASGGDPAPFVRPTLYFRPPGSVATFQRWVPVTPVSGVQITADSGQGVLGLTASDTAKKIAVVAVTASMGLAALGTAKKVSVDTGQARLGLAPNAIHVQIAVDTGLAELGLAAAGTAKKVVVATGRSALGLTATGTAKKVVVSTERAALGLSATDTAKKVSADTGQATLGLTQNVSRVPATADTGLGTAGLAARVTAKKVTVAACAATLGLAGRSTAQKLAKAALVAPAGLSGAVTARKVSSGTGTAYVGVSPRFAGLDIRTVAARVFLALRAQHHQCTTYRSYIGTTTRPGTGATARPSSGTTSRPGTGTTARPDTGTTKDECT